MDTTQRELGYEGAERAVAHANRVVDTGWSRKALDRFQAFLVASGVGTVFVTSDAARWCIAHGLPEPPDARSWGFFTREAAKMGLIRDTGRRPRCGSHGRECPEWEIVRLA